MTSTTDTRSTPPKAIDIVRAFSERRAHVDGLRFIDWGEPTCFVCGLSDASWAVGDLDDSIALLEKRWKRSRLQKAHLVPHQFGGANTPDNFAMLCRDCHRDAPDTPDAEAALRWIARREHHIATLAREIDGAASPGCVARWIEAGSPRPDVSDVAGSAGLHWDADPGGGPILSVGTKAVLLAAAIESALAERM
ncbi:HNH endonuclease [Rhodococcus sp. ABRD24]|uniref:HNH endonuclease n=1 Tax=Rhodococcus sp. ABRD24 TaxID=2507582 RepID=UPI001038B9D3|nr:HNH endonuclease signature motif containing protein [Rhodococcus sp. ABRD24]QBJ96798.1 HNH endonuclease [Rhodococcus sp. ABRD24]